MSITSLQTEFGTTVRRNEADTRQQNAIHKFHCMYAADGHTITFTYNVIKL
jgi:predicted transcriptional regulator